MIKLSKAAKQLGVCKQTLWNWKKEGKIHFEKIGSMNFVTTDELHRLLGIKERQEDETVIYCRVSSTVNKTNLESQKERLLNYCTRNGFRVKKIVTEFGSGINDKRPKLEKLLKEQDFTRIVVEHKDRLTRVGFNYIKVLLEVNNKELHVVNEVDTDKEDLIQDFVAIVTSYCARLYGSRRSKRKTEELIKNMEKNH